MTLRIEYRYASPETITDVRMTTLYTSQDGRALPEIVIHFNDISRQQVNIPLHEVSSIATS